MRSLLPGARGTRRGTTSSGSPGLEGAVLLIRVCLEFFFGARECLRGAREGPGEGCRGSWVLATWDFSAHRVT